MHKLALVTMAALIGTAAFAQDEPGRNKIAPMDVSQLREIFKLEELSPPKVLNAEQDLDVRWKEGDKWTVEVFWSGPGSGDPNRPQEMIEWAKTPSPYTFEVDRYNPPSMTRANMDYRSDMERVRRLAKLGINLHRLKQTDSKGNWLDAFDVALGARAQDFLSLREHALLAGDRSLPDDLPLEVKADDEHHLDALLLDYLLLQVQPGYHRGRVVSLELPEPNAKGRLIESSAGISRRAVELLGTLPNVPFPRPAGNVVELEFDADVTYAKKKGGPIPPSDLDERIAELEGSGKREIVIEGIPFTLDDLKALRGLALGSPPERGTVYQRWDSRIPVYPLTSLTLFPGGWWRLTILREVRLAPRAASGE